MSRHPESLDHMLAAWNERDPKRVRAHLDRALSPDVVFIDPSVVTRGIDEFEANVHEVHGRLPGADYLRASGIDRHHDVVRYAWEIRREGSCCFPDSTSPSSTTRGGSCASSASSGRCPRRRVDRAPVPPQARHPSVGAAPAVIFRATRSATMTQPR